MASAYAQAPLPAGSPSCVLAPLEAEGSHLSCSGVDGEPSLRALTTESLANLDVDISQEDELSHELSHNSEPWDLPAPGAGSGSSSAQSHAAHQRPLNPHAAATTRA